jgi:glycosyltransferase involved in cell wall biosynthesis
MHNILHITNEITKKNFSISSLINFITLHGKNHKTINSKILCSEIDKSSIIKKEYLIIKKIKWLNFFKFKKIFFDEFNRYDLIHIHGIWAPIQIFSIIFSVLNKKKITIHSHGMLLFPAINNGGFFKKFFKNIFLIFLRIITSNSNSLNFIAITNEEYNAIKTLLPNSSIQLIPNNIPFKNFFTKEKVFDYQKKFVFFGRIHPHKNILLLIDLFIKSNLMKNGWSLEIYGIKDDEKYLKKIKNSIVSYPNIKILKPVFGKKKASIIRKAWANILVSKSEVLSFSVLESGIYGLSSIITKNIETLKGDKISNKVKNEESSIIKKIVEVSNWSLSKRKSIGERTKNFFYNYKIKSQKSILQSLDKHYDNIINNTIKTSKASLESFYISSLVHSLNVFLPNIILFLSFISFGSKFAAEIGLTNITFITLTQMLSGNIRLISVQQKNTQLLKSNLFFRLIFGFIILFLFQVASYNFEIIEEFRTTFLISSLIILLWCSELALSIFEIRRDIIKLLLALFFYLLLIFILIISFILKDLLLIDSIILISISGLFLFCIQSLRKNLNLKFDIKNLFGKKIGFEQYLSSISSPLSSMSWRFYLFFSYSKEISGTIFIAFAICSFPGTFFNSVVGPNYFYNRISINPKFKIIFIISLVLILIYNIFTFNNYNIYEINEYSLFFHVLKISLLGSLVMIYAMYYRQNAFFKRDRSTINIFYKDIYYGLVLIFILPLLDIIGGLNALVYSYTLSAIFAVFVFKKINY